MTTAREWLRNAEVLYKAADPLPSNGDYYRRLIYLKSQTCSLLAIATALVNMEEEQEQELKTEYKDPLWDKITKGINKDVEPTTDKE